MEKEIRVLVVDDNKNIVNEIKEYFSSHAVIKVVDVAYDGENALNKLTKEKYDLVIMDLIIPLMDGLSVLEEISKRRINVKSIITTAANSFEVIKKCYEVGINYYLLKPYKYDILENIIKEVMTSNHKGTIVSDKDLKQAITTLLHSLGVPSHIKGYTYIRDGIDLMYNNPSLIGAITKELYPEIADRYDTTSSRVERAIRHAIEVSWNRGDYELMENIFGHSVDYDRAKPTNSEFIATLADRLKIERTFE